MCGIAGLIRRGDPGNIGSEMTSMLRSLKHRGPDSTGFAMYGVPEKNHYVMRFKVAEQEDIGKGFDIHQQIKDRRALVNSRLDEMGVEVKNEEEATEYAFRYTFRFDGDMRRTADYLEDIEGVEIMSLGKGLELIKDLGDADVVSESAPEPLEILFFLEVLIIFGLSLSSLVIDKIIASLILIIFSSIFALSICFFIFETPGSIDKTPSMPPIFFICLS